MKLKINIKNYLVIKAQKIIILIQTKIKSLTKTKEDVKNSFKEAVKDKDISWDLIPGKCLKDVFKAKKERKFFNI